GRRAPRSSATPDNLLPTPQTEPQPASRRVVSGPDGPVSSPVGLVPSIGATPGDPRAAGWAGTSLATSFSGKVFRPVGSFVEGAFSGAVAGGVFGAWRGSARSSRRRRSRSW